MSTRLTQAAHLAERRWRAMGAAAHLVVAVESGQRDAELLADDAIAEIETLEAQWSRFRATSELTRLNALAGTPVLVSAETFDLIDHAIDAWRATSGRFDPTVLGALLAAGYDRDYRALAAAVDDVDARPSQRRAPERAPGCGGIELDPIVSAVTLPAGVTLDLGGIGKGRAADLVAADLVARGACGALVNLGGDLRAAGTPPTDHGWIVDIDPVLERDLGSVALHEGAIATSSQLTRAWQHRGTRLHHLIDPRTGVPADTDLAAVTVIAGEAWWAEVLAKAALIGGAGRATTLLDDLDVAALLVSVDGRTVELGTFSDFRVVSPIVAGH